MSYSFHPAAELDAANAQDYYEEHAGPAVARKFAAEIERVAKLLGANPGFGTASGSGRRTYPLQVFPYSLVYRQIASGVRILAVRHQHRKPGYGSRRA